MGRDRPAASLRRGFTLVELLAVLAIAAVLLGFGVPSLQSRAQEARRTEAVAALTRIQMAQEAYRGQNGVYAAEPRLLAGASMLRSDGGAYDLSLSDALAQSYVAVAKARAGGPQAADAECQVLTLRVTDGLVDKGPSLRCWGPA